MEAESKCWASLEIDGYSETQIGYHLEIMKEAGLIEAEIMYLRKKDGPIGIPKRLTWAGHEFLDAAREPGLWEKAKAQLLKVGGSVTLDVMKELLTTLAKKQIGLDS